jgi:hypothetical protein
VGSFRDVGWQGNVADLLGMICFSSLNKRKDNQKSGLVECRTNPVFIVF